ncbi:hypothetical protein LTR17_011463 [Elasticomyces elasticus]|nr:hypothetical protein LTR17_011463 [Elasticomyces elasticus]
MAPPPDPKPQEQHDSVVHEPSPAPVVHELSPTPPSSHDESQANEILEYLPKLQRKLDRLPEDYDRIVKLAEYSMRYTYLYLTYIYQHPEWIEKVQELRQSVGEELGQTGAERRAESIEDHGGEAVVAKRQQELFGQWQGFGGEDEQGVIIAKSSDQVMLDEPEVWYDAETGDDPMASEAKEEQATASMSSTDLATRCYANTPDKI